MGKTLFLARHAHTEFSGSQDDNQRFLSEKGIEDAREIAHSIAEDYGNVDHIICNDILRASETATLFAEKLGVNLSTIEKQKNLFNISPEELLAIIQNIDVAHEKVLLVSHNSALTYFLEYLTGSNYVMLNPCMVAVLYFESDSWADIKPASGRLITIRKPLDDRY
ncbi:MAG: histidine phosphatase family protein [Bernardetiaceae bacterium]|nr:histidine phosphatase family protein [Bernardetiaceae bacterium]